MQKMHNIRTAVIIIVGTSLAFILLSLLGGGRRIPENPPETVGNTAGNLNNSGLFCEQGDTVYFSNSYDNGTLYAMDSNEENIRKLSSVIVCNLLSDEHYLYFFQLGVSGSSNFSTLVSDRGFFRADPSGKNFFRLTKDIIVNCQLVGNHFYFLTGTDNGPLFYKIKNDLSERIDLAHYQINPSCARDGIIYYNGTREDHALYALNTDTDVSTLVYDANLWFPVIYGEYIYYMDVPHNYRLCRYSLTEQREEVLTNDRIDCFNVGSGYIYYQKNGAQPQLKCMRTDGTDEIILAEGDYTHIHMTSQYVYFQEFGDEITIYHSPLGSSQYERFYSAEMAAATAVSAE